MYQKPAPLNSGQYPAVLVKRKTCFSLFKIYKGDYAGRTVSVPNVCVPTFTLNVELFEEKEKGTDFVQIYNRTQVSVNETPRAP